MSILFDAASGSINSDKTGSGTVSWTHTPVGIPAVVTVNVQWTFSINNPGAMSISGITYGGQAMALVGTSSAAGNLEKWILISPPSGPQSVVITWLDDTNPQDSVVARANSTTYTSSGGVTYGALQSASGSVTPITKTVMFVANNSMLDTLGGVADGSSAFITVTVNGTNETKRSGVTNFGDGTTFGRLQVYCSTQTGIDNVTANATESANRTWGLLILELKELFGSSFSQLVGGGA